MTDASFVDRIAGPPVIDHRKPPIWRLTYDRFQQAAVEAKQDSQYSAKPDPGPFWRQPLAVCLVGYVVVLIILAVVVL